MCGGVARVQVRPKAFGRSLPRATRSSDSAAPPAAYALVRNPTFTCPVFVFTVTVTTPTLT